MKLVAGRGEADGDATSADPGWLLGNYPPLEEPWATARAAGGQESGLPRSRHLLSAARQQVLAADQPLASAPYQSELNVGSRG